MANLEIRKMLKAEKIKHIEVARKIGVTESSFSRIMRYPLSLKNRKRIMEAVREIKHEKG